MADVNQNGLPAEIDDHVFQTPPERTNGEPEEGIPVTTADVLETSLDATERSVNSAETEQPSEEPAPEAALSASTDEAGIFDVVPEPEPLPQEASANPEPATSEAPVAGEFDAKAKIAELREKIRNRDQGK